MFCEFRMPVIAKPLRQIRRRRRGGCRELVTKSAILARVRPIKKCVHFLLQFISEFPRIEFFESASSHAKTISNRNASTPHPAPRTPHPAPCTLHFAPVTRHQAPAPGTQHQAPGTLLLYCPARMFFRGQIIGKYKILQTIGSGGFGTVYLAEDTWIDKKVALKVPHKQGVDFGELLREPRLLASLNHPNIVTILTAEKQENIFFIVMEFVPGETLETIVVREGALELSRALDYTCQVCNAVEHAHRQNVIHRDLRPSNVLVTDRGLLKVADFGTSRFLEIAAHGTTVIGSPPYMAPEQFYGKAVFASDIYSLGVTMYQMLTGSLPYDTPSPSDLERLMRGEMQVGPKLKNPKVPKAINDIVLKAMAPDIPSRYQRAGDLLDDVLAARDPAPARRTPTRGTTATDAETAAAAAEIQARLKAREAPSPRFCWHCRKPLHARSDRCPFCGETQ